MNLKVVVRFAVGFAVRKNKKKYYIKYGLILKKVSIRIKYYP
jgi:hypothetical protein